jgi:hypothetical protein
MEQQFGAGLAGVVAARGSDTKKWNVDETADDILYTSIGLAAMEPQPWQNRPSALSVRSN